MTAFRSLSDLHVIPIWDGIAARAIEGREMTFAVVELAPDTTVRMHQHPNEQVGMVMSGVLRFTVGAESRDLRPGDTYVVSGGTPHEAVSGPDGAVVIDAFSPIREDWRQFALQPPRPCSWP